MKDMDFEKALEKLEKTVEELESGEVSLDMSLKKYEEGIKLVRLCQKKLNEAKQRVELLMKDEKGRFSKMDFEDEEK
ncbi:MAG TPA: exodeoxyribonuclease VII small subunit [Candidatus Omnitrophota bacterium]|nr:exodeoxyribonuclease VII small subunit [Candidatus Omnitrophota bacterium]HPS19784.1 exodeoxyribonuclease VII small subunit [Candidatus Omnitrophota bacterium]